MKKSEEDLSFTDTFFRGSFNKYKGIFNEKVGTDLFYETFSIHMTLKKTSASHQL